jgi:hypothetical protein
LPPYDKEKYKEMILDAAETALGFFGFDRSAYTSIKKGNRRNWFEQLRKQDDLTLKEVSLSYLIIFNICSLVLRLHRQ